MVSPDEQSACTRSANGQELFWSLNANGNTSRRRLATRSPSPGYEATILFSSPHPVLMLYPLMLMRYFLGSSISCLIKISSVPNPALKPTSLTLRGLALRSTCHNQMPPVRSPGYAQRQAAFGCPLISPSGLALLRPVVPVSSHSPQQQQEHADEQ